MTTRLLKGLDPADVEEFGIELDGSDAPSLPRLIALLPEADREPYMAGTAR